MFSFIKSLFSWNSKNTHSVRNNIKENGRSEYEPAFSYIFKKKRIVFENILCFTVRYLVHDREVWMLAQDFARGISYREPDNVADVVQSQYVKSLNEILLFRNNDSSSNDSKTSSEICVNKYGILQILDNVEFAEKSKFTTWLIEIVFAELESESRLNFGHQQPSSHLDSKLVKVLDAIESLKNTSFVIADLRQDICEMFNKLEKKMSAEELHKMLHEYYRRHEPVNGKDTMEDGHLSFLSDSRLCDINGEDNEERQLCRYETVRFPRDSSKHPRLAVYAKELDANCTEIAFLSGQSRRHRTLKRKYDDMELIYDDIHPNPQLAILCFNEELDMKSLKFRKKNRRLMQVDCSLATARSFIHENL
ncbi:hypothetical protein [Rachiplusia nu nucleopolyhedrovirus]|uniref:Bro-N domain-containing protein n=1 Tax=Rachiplusia nu nucleopolyhedrovirus TaxID=2605775 RepID=A0AAE6M7K5_9ABAC|nr:hypothetical protein QKQ55_gp120 [Rachiplusia nu nucleopolyhedrovirus]QEI03700.1 hypothetical protein [Rachiplusia nu nucleopolyhedrovirus]